MSTMFQQFPKTRPVLPPEFQRIYERHYRANRDGASPVSAVAQRLEAWMHRQVAADVAARNSQGATLELGAGTLNHLAFEQGAAAYDVVEPSEFFYRDSSHRSRVRTIYRDIAEIPAELRYARIISVAVCEHLCDLPAIVARSGLLLAQRGSFRAGIPSEGTILWRAAQSLSTGLEFGLRHGLDYRVFSNYEHVNTADEIEQVLGYFFHALEAKFFGLSRGLSLYRFYACGEPDRERCERYLSDIR